MPGHTRQEGRVSLSAIFSGRPRSLSKARVRHVQLPSPNESYRSSSSMSCNPHQQSAVTPELVTAMSKVVAEASLEATVESDVSAPAQLQTSLPTDMPQPGRQLKARPLSWLLFPHPSFRKMPTRSKSTHLPKASSAPSMNRSVISAPVLTSTTNSKVAEAKGVLYGDDPHPELSGDPQHDQTRAGEHRAEGGTPDHGSAKSGRFRLTSFRRKKRNQDASCVPKGHVQGDAREFVDDSQQLVMIEEEIARRRTETINLGHKKINKLTGDGHIKRKSVNNGNGGAQTATDDSSRRQAPAQNTRTHDFPSLDDSNTDLTFGSLTRSFVSAVDNLDFYSSTANANNMGFIKSKSSIFSLRKRTKNGSGDIEIENKKARSVKSALAKHDVADNEEDEASPGTALTMREALKLIPPAPHASYRKLKGSHPDPAHFSATENRYVPAEPFPGYPRGANPLRMHTNPLEFATPPPDVKNLPKPPRHTPTLEEVTPLPESDDEDELEDAPIYSPSSGDLSQYSRQTPQSAQVMNESGKPSEQDTPTRVQAEKGYLRRLGLRRSKSGSTLLHRFSRAQRNPHKALESEDTNQKMPASPVRKSRSIYFGNLFGKRDTSTTTESLLQEEVSTPFRPVASSPLRHAAYAEDNDTHLSDPVVHSAQRRSPPRGNTTPLEQAKRLGVIGMPRESFDAHLRRR